MDNKRIIFQGIILVLVLIVIGVFFGLNYTGFFSASTVSNDSIKVGVILPLTGGAASYGVPMNNAILLAVEEINQSGGINGKKIRLLIEDGKGDSKEAVNAANKLINIEKVSVIFTGTSSESLAVAPIVNSNKVIQMAVATSATSYSNAGDYSFRTFPPASYYVGKLAKYAFEVKGVRRIALLYQQKEFPVSTAEAFKSRFVSLGGKMVLEQQFGENETDFKTYLEKISQTNADSVFIAAQTESNFLPLFKQIHEMDLYSKYILFSNTPGTTIKMFNVSNGLNKNVFTADMYSNRNWPKVKNFLEKYKNKYGTEPETTLYWVGASYDSVKLISNALSECGETNTNCIKDFLYNTKNKNGTWGSISIDPNGDILPTIALHYFNADGKEVWEELPN